MDTQISRINVPVIFIRAWCVWVGSNGLGMIDAVARHVHGCAIRQIANLCNAICILSGDALLSPYASGFSFEPCQAASLPNSKSA